MTSAAFRISLRASGRRRQRLNAPWMRWATRVASAITAPVLTPTSVPLSLRTRPSTKTHSTLLGCALKTTIGCVHRMGADQHVVKGSSQVEGTQRLLLPVVLRLKQVHVELDAHLACQLRHAAEGVHRRLRNRGVRATDLEAGPRMGIDQITLDRTHVIHVLKASTIGKGKPQAGIQQRLDIPAGEVGTEGMTPVDDCGHPSPKQVQRAQADNRVCFRFGHVESAHRKHAGLQPVSYGQRSPTAPNERLPQVVVDVDEPGLDDLARGVNRSGSRAVQPLAYGSDAVALD
jgi:hypothetical protein